MQTQPFETVVIDSQKFDLHELSFFQAVTISRIPDWKNEHRITAFLKAVLGDGHNPLAMTAQARYYFLIRYLAAMPECLASVDIKPENYLLDDHAASLVTELSDRGYSVRQLIGHDLQALESVCASMSDWIVGCMSMQLSAPDLPMLPDPLCSDAERESSLKARAQIIKEWPLSVFDRAYAAYSAMNDAMMGLCALGLDEKGLTVLGGGADDAPVRFRPSTAFTGVARELDRRVHDASTSNVQ